MLQNETLIFTHDSRYCYIVS